MSVWPQSSPAASLTGSEGVLVSVSIHVDPRHLESLIEALAQVGFPVNPQIYHDALIVYRYPDGSEESEGVTLVEFPAYEGRLEEVRRALDAYSFSKTQIHVSSILDAIHAEWIVEQAPASGRQVTRYCRKSRSADADRAVHTHS
jgi:hypothetical protein